MEARGTVAATPNTRNAPPSVVKNVEESRQARLQRQQSRIRDRGGIFIPTVRNTLADILCGRREATPKKPRQSRSRSRSPHKQPPSPTTGKERRVSIHSSAAVNTGRISVGKPSLRRSPRKKSAAGVVQKKPAAKNNKSKSIFSESIAETEDEVKSTPKSSNKSIQKPRRAAKQAALSDDDEPSIPRPKAKRKLSIVAEEDDPALPSKSSRKKQTIPERNVEDAANKKPKTPKKTSKQAVVSEPSTSRLPPADDDVPPVPRPKTKRKLSIVAEEDDPDPPPQSIQPIPRPKAKRKVVEVEDEAPPPPKPSRKKQKADPARPGDDTKSKKRSPKQPLPEDPVSDDAQAAEAPETPRARRTAKVIESEDDDDEPPLPVPTKAKGKRAASVKPTKKTAPKRKLAKVVESEHEDDHEESAPRHSGKKVVPASPKAKGKRTAGPVAEDVGRTKKKAKTQPLQEVDSPEQKETKKRTARKSPSTAKSLPQTRSRPSQLQKENSPASPVSTSNQSDIQVPVNFDGGRVVPSTKIRGPRKSVMIRMQEPLPPVEDNDPDPIDFLS